VDIAGVRLANPLLTASGTCGYADEYADFVDLAELGAFVTKSITREPRRGNEYQRIIETRAGMLNAIGLANIGYDAFVNDAMPRLRERGATVIVNTYGTSTEEFAELARRFDKIEGVAGLEINISCPNVKSGGMHFGMLPEPAAEVTRAVRGETGLPVIVKLSPEAADLTAVADAVQAAGADAVSLINTIRGMSIDIHTRKPRLGNIIGGLSGPAIRAVAVRMVFEVHRALPELPIIGIGGILDLPSALEFFLAGASAVQVGTANFANPRAATDLIDALYIYCAERNILPSNLVGKVILE